MTKRGCARLVISTLLSLGGLTSAQDGKTTYVTPAEAAADPDYALQGEYTADKLGVQVVAQGKGQFRVVVHRGGLPGAGWDGSERQVMEEDADGVKSLLAEMQLKKVERTSPSLGAKPPEGAVVLFDGTREPLETHWKPGARMTEDGLLEQGVTSVDTFQDYTLHLEFFLSYMPGARGQGRGNSGVYHQGRYETQILDSFGLEGKNNECGGLYEIRDPDLNMCLPPLAWQTYDVDFTAARFNDKGEKTASARITVRLNGVIVHQDAEVPRTTRAAPLGNESAEPGPIYIQDHGNPVRFRNIWVLPRDAAKEARRPIVPGFERFFAVRGADFQVRQSVGDTGSGGLGTPPHDAGGRLLLGELGCTNCHSADDALASRIVPRKGPILDDVGKRVHPEWLIRFLADPHRVKPGTTMPDLLAGWSESERDEAALALTSFLVSTGRVPQKRAERQAARRGEKLFEQIGCMACHQPDYGQKPGFSEKPGFSSSTTIPLPDLAEKYSLPSLTAFLKDPHAVRPAGRMPGFNLVDKEAEDLASFLLEDTQLRSRRPNMRFAMYRGNWDRIPDFAQLQPRESGECEALDIGVAGRSNEFAIRFEGFLHVPRDGEYTFHLGSDDGSVLFIDGEKVVDGDGIHAHQTESGKATLTAGAHPIRVDYHQQNGEWSLALEYEGPDVPRQDAYTAIGLTADPATTPAAANGRGSDDSGFAIRADLVPHGRELFASLGCANCHSMKYEGQAVASTLTAKPLRDLDASRGCLASVASGGREAAEHTPGGEAGAASSGLTVAARPPHPEFDLSSPQRDALKAVLRMQPALNATETQVLADTMTAFNCYACHARHGVGGPERDRNPLFRTTIQEMGDEGRVPPPLDGVGDKLNNDWLKHVLRDGAKDRPYMLTRMPRFQLANLDALVRAFVVTDRIEAADVPQSHEPEHRLKATGRQLVGEQSLGCVKCHTFGRHRATGIQALDLQTMTRRLREDWFHRYMVKPQAYRPGTRMPTGFPNGQATIRDVYDGDPRRQLAAIWAYLKDGNKAGVPEGVIGKLIELKPEQDPILYRAFLEGLSPRGIAVGYPEKCHLAWDANRMCLALLWHGRFIDASMHWEGRGDGFQRPLGDHVIRWEETAPVAVLTSTDAPWPGESPKDRGYAFRGYRLNERKQPTFLYQTPQFRVEDFPQPVARGAEGVFTRRLTITAAEPVENVYVRVAAGRKIEPQADGAFLVNGAVRVKLTSAATSILRESNGREELLVPLDLTTGSAEVIKEIVW